MNDISISGSRVLVTGGSGFIGQQCIGPLLKGGYDVHSASHTRGHEPQKLASGSATQHRTNLHDRSDVDSLLRRVEPDVLLHLAWCTEPGTYWTSPENLRWVESSEYLVRAFARYGGQRVMVAGTCAEYDWENGLCHEDTTPLRPTSEYGKAKAMLHRRLQALGGSESVSLAWARIFFVYGPGEHASRLVPSLVRSLCLGQPALCTSGEQRRDYLHVSDVGALLVGVLRSNREGAVNIASGNAPPVREIIQTVARLLARQDLIRLGALPDKNEPPLVVADVSRLLGAVGDYRFRGLEEGLEATVQWWQSHLATCAS